MDISIAIFCQYHIDILLKLKQLHRSSTNLNVSSITVEGLSWHMQLQGHKFTQLLHAFL